MDAGGEDLCAVDLLGRFQVLFVFSQAADTDICATVEQVAKDVMCGDAVPAIRGIWHTLAEEEDVQ